MGLAWGRRQGVLGLTRIFLSRHQAGGRLPRSQSHEVKSQAVRSLVIVGGQGRGAHRTAGEAGGPGGA